MLKNEANCSISIYNHIGQKVRILLQNEFVQGDHSIFWDGKDNAGNSLPNGVYFYKLQYGHNQSFGKMAMIK